MPNKKEKDYFFHQLWIFVVLSLILVSGCEELGYKIVKIEKDGKTNTITSFKDIVNNPEEYINKTISIRGKSTSYDRGSPDVGILTKYGTNTYFYIFTDDDAYAIYVIPKGRQFERSEYYVVSGIFIKSLGDNYYLIEE